MPRATVTIAFLTTLLLAIGCGAQDEQAKKPRNVQSGDLTEDLYCGKDSQPKAALLDDPALRQVPADKLRALNGAADTTLCDLLRESGKKLLLLQFASVKCYSCLKWIDNVANSLVASGKNNNVLSVVALTDRIEFLSEDEAKRLKQDVAKKSVWVYDFYGDLWSFFGTTPWTGEGEPQLSPVLVAVDADARGFYTEDLALDGPGAVALSERVMGSKFTD